MTRALLVLICTFAALSSSVAEALGLQGERVVLFAALVGLLCAHPFLRGAPLPRPGAGLVCLFLLLAGIAVQDALSGGLDPVDYKVALLLLVLAAAPAVAEAFDGDAGLERFAWRLLSLYVVATFAYQLAAEPAAVARGYAGIVRYDPTGSVVMHASLSLVCLLMALGRVASAERTRERLTAVAVAAAAVVMVLQTATRTVVVTLALFACFRVATAGDRRETAGLVLTAGAGLALVFAAYTLLWDASFLLRLTSTEGVEDYGSGRLPSLVHWLGLLGDRPLGLGFGAVRELMADGKPHLEGDSTLEWPHNEFVRFYVEAGPLGLAFVVLLLGLLVRKALLAAAHDPRPARRALMLAAAADLVAEACLQNLFNAIYHATVLVTLLALAAEGARRAAEDDGLAGAAPSPELASAWP